LPSLRMELPRPPGLEEKQKKQVERMERAAKLLAARGAGAARARVQAIESARAIADSAASTDAMKTRLMRDLLERRLAREQTIQEAKIKQAARNRSTNIRRRAAEHEEEQRRREDNEQRRKAELDRAEAERAGMEAARQAARTHFSFARRAEASANARAEERFRTFEQQYQQRPRHTRQMPRGNSYGALPPRAAVQTEPSKLQGEAVDIGALPLEALVLHTLRFKGCSHRCLGVPPNATTVAVRKRYLSLARRLHPDKTDHPSAAEAFSAIESAFFEASRETRRGIAPA